MPLSTNLATYEDCRSACDQALDSPRGVIIRCKTKGAAVHMRQRLYKFRVLDRERNSILYPDRADPMHGNSAYDMLVFNQVDQVIYVKKLSADSVVIEEITDEI